VARVIVYAVVDDALSPDFPLGDSLEVFIRREDAKRFIDEAAATIPSSRATSGSRSGSSRWVRRTSRWTLTSYGPSLRGL
jgi:hypothetical protein